MGSAQLAFGVPGVLLPWTNLDMSSRQLESEGLSRFRKLVEASAPRSHALQGLLSRHAVAISGLVGCICLAMSFLQFNHRFREAEGVGFGDVTCK